MIFERNDCPRPISYLVDSKLYQYSIEKKARITFTKDERKDPTAFFGDFLFLFLLQNKRTDAFWDLKVTYFSRTKKKI